jgi:hypothetical protein
VWSRLLMLMEMEACRAKFGEADIAMRLNTAAIGWSTPSRGASSGNAAIIPLVGLMFHRPGPLATIFGWRGTSDVPPDVQAASEAAGVDAILLDVDTGRGGGVGGTEDLADAIAKAARRKPVMASVNTMAASAGYWAIAGATEISITPSGQAGAVGVVATRSLRWCRVRRAPSLPVSTRISNAAAAGTGSRKRGDDDRESHPVIRWQNTYGKIRGFDRISYFVYVDELVDVLTLHPGQRVEFKPVAAEKGPRAEAVRRVEAW